MSKKNEQDTRMMRDVFTINQQNADHIPEEGMRSLGAGRVTIRRPGRGGGEVRKEPAFVKAQAAGRFSNGSMERLRELIR